MHCIIEHSIRDRESRGISIRCCMINDRDCRNQRWCTMAAVRTSGVLVLVVCAVACVAFLAITNDVGDASPLELLAKAERQKMSAALRLSDKKATGKKLTPEQALQAQAYKEADSALSECSL